MGLLRSLFDAMFVGYYSPCMARTYVVEIYMYIINYMSCQLLHDAPAERIIEDQRSALHVLFATVFSGDSQDGELHCKVEA
jgi:hypothetical protein